MTTATTPAPAEQTAAHAHSGRRIAYLVSQYPAVSHTFIQNEVLGLRRLGFKVETASVNGVDVTGQAYTEVERNEQARTFFVKKAGLFRMCAAMAATLIRRPVSFLRGLGLALRLEAFRGRPHYALFYSVEAVLVGDWMRRERCPHLHVHFGGAAATLARIAAEIFGINYSFTVHGPDEFYDVHGNHLADKLAAASFVICIGTYAKSQLMRLSHPSHWNKFEICPLGVNPDLFLPSWTSASDDMPEILCVGRLVPAKGQRVLLQAAKLLQEAGYLFRLRFAGDGPDREGLQEQAYACPRPDWIIFEGAVSHPRVRELLSRASVFALPSFAEGIPVALMEAMAMRVPCVTTYITGIPELIRDSVDGVLVPPADENALASALARLLNDRDERRRLGAAGRERVMDKYNFEPNLARLAEVFATRISGGTQD